MATYYYPAWYLDGFLDVEQKKERKSHHNPALA